MQLYFFVCSIKCLIKLNLDVQQWMQALNKWEGRWNRGEWNRARIVTHLMYCSGSNAAINAQYILIARCVLTVWHAQMTDTMLRCSWRRSWWTSRRNSSRRRTSWTNSPKAWKTHRKNWNCQRRQPQTWVVGARPSLTPRQTCQQRLTCETKLISSDQSKHSFFFFFPKKKTPLAFSIFERHSHYCGTSEARAHSSTAGLIASQHWLWVHFDPGQSVCSTSEAETFLCSHSWRMNTRINCISPTHILRLRVWI